MTVVTIAAVVFTGVTTCAVGFQLALAAGAPWGAYAIRGRFPGRFPPAARVAAVIQASILGLLAAIVLARAGLMFERLQTSATWPVWIVVAVSAISL